MSLARPTARRTITVDLPAAKYDIHVQPGLLHDVGMILSRIAPSKKACIITDDTVGPQYAATLSSGLANAGYTVAIEVLPSGEARKTLSTLEPIFDRLLRGKIDRHTPIIALGGGVVGDMAGFVAATILRGVPFVQVPTTLLAMVDASVGGKTGVNAAAGKNLIGAFHQPMLVCIDPNVLRSLPARELRGGLAECIKHEIIRDADGFASLEHNVGKALSLDIEFLSALIAHNVAIKAKVVEADPLERGERAHLNLGHTFGHAIEKVSNFQISHGEAVSYGIAAAAHVAEELGLLEPASRTRIIALLTAAELPTSGLPLDPPAVAAAMAFDKKVEGQKIRIVLPDGIGRATIRDNVPPELIRLAINDLR